MKRLILGSFSVFIVGLLWFFYARAIDNPLAFASPAAVLNDLSKLMLHGNTYETIGISLIRLLSAVIFSGLVGITTGLLAGRFLSVDYFLHPVVSALRTLPIASVIVILWIIFATATALFAIAFLMLFPIFHEATKQGVRHIEGSLLDALAMEPFRPLMQLLKIFLPLSAPYIKTAMLQSFGLGFKVLIMAEFIMQPQDGIGIALYRSSLAIDSARMLSWTVLIIVIAVTIEILVGMLRTAPKKT